MELSGPYFIISLVPETTCTKNTKHLLVPELLLFFALLSSLIEYGVFLYCVTSGKMQCGFITFKKSTWLTEKVIDSWGVIVFLWLRQIADNHNFPVLILAEDLCCYFSLRFLCVHTLSAIKYVQSVSQKHQQFI